MAHRSPRRHLLDGWREAESVVESLACPKERGRILVDDCLAVAGEFWVLGRG